MNKKKNIIVQQKVKEIGKCGKRNDMKSKWFQLRLSFIQDFMAIRTGMCFALIQLSHRY